MNNIVISNLALSLLGLTLVACSTTASQNKGAQTLDKIAVSAPITTQEVNSAQQAWCDSLVKIAKTYASGGDYKTVATEVLNNQYNYNYGPVLFKPTLTFDEQTFRLDKEGAASYFIGGNPKYPNDTGFALKPWVSCRYDNAGEGNEGVVIDGNYAFTMGNVFITDSSGKVTKVDKFFAFKRGADGKLRLAVHKSSLPYKPK